MPSLSSGWDAVAVLRLRGTVLAVRDRGPEPSAVRRVVRVRVSRSTLRAQRCVAQPRGFSTAAARCESPSRARRLVLPAGSAHLAANGTRARVRARPSRPCVGPRPWRAALARDDGAVRGRTQRVGVGTRRPGGPAGTGIARLRRPVAHPRGSRPELDSRPAAQVAEARADRCVLRGVRVRPAGERTRRGSARACTGTHGCDRAATSIDGAFCGSVRVSVLAHWHPTSAGSSPRRPLGACQPQLHRRHRRDTRGAPPPRLARRIPAPAALRLNPTDTGSHGPPSVHRPLALRPVGRGVSGRHGDDHPSTREQLVAL